jgi:quercetin dioxygenase-like cupin family protein
MIVKAVQDIEEVPVTEAGARSTTIRWVLNVSDGVPTFAMRYFVVKPGGCTPRHAHSWEHEIFIVRGTCTAFCEGETRQVDPDHAIYIGPEAIHSLANNGTEDLVFLCMIPI